MLEDIVIKSKRNVNILIIVSVCLILASLFANYYRYNIGYDRYLVRFFVFVSPGVKRSGVKP